MQKLGKLIKTNLKNHKIEGKIQKYEVCHLWERALLAHLPEANKKTMVTSFERGTLNVAVLSKDMADQITICQKRIIYWINSELGKSLVYKISCEA